jgi:hypothetical protein
LALTGFADARFVLAGVDAIEEADRPATFGAIDGHGNFGVGRRMRESGPEDEEIRAKLGYRQDMATHVQFDLDICGMRLHAGCQPGEYVLRRLTWPAATNW